MNITKKTRESILLSQRVKKKKEYPTLALFFNRKKLSSESLHVRVFLHVNTHRAGHTHTYTQTHTTINGAQITQMRTCAHQDLD
jgi:hypothetical protein